MKQGIIIAGLVGFIVGIFVAPVFGPVMPMMWGNRMGQNYMGGGQMMGSQIDRHFIEQMIPHHEDAITMANLALSRAEHKEIKQLANDIIKAQSDEITQMEAWYKDWYGKQVPDFSRAMGHGMNMMHGGMMGDATDIQRLEKATPFDQAFIEEMIPHHQMAVMMAQMLEQTTDRSEMRDLAENIIKAQTREINSMRSWYRQWYSQ